MLKSITKTIRVPQDFMVEEFLAKQKNFSAAVRYLIFCYCRDHQDGIEDLSDKYDQELQQSFYQVHGPAPAKAPSPAQPVIEKPMVLPTPKVSAPSIGFNRMRASDTGMTNAHQIPACYR